ncbi:hypothetical protein [Croceicoccus hydrothermalis]|uniref:hypothetical protein n=1 Tax=Croceicoccus hydrothermalis TaxID=2867964 RepID=UPI001EFAAB54|nr:hypothetical protein [Croceicoccus hydrothermalis]
MMGRIAETPRLVAMGALTVVLGACSQGEPARQETVAEQVIDDAEPEDGELLHTEDFARSMIGPRIQGPRGPMIRSSFEGPDGTTGTIESFVACPIETSGTACNPAELPETTIFTYVMRVTPDERASAFRTAVPVFGYAGVAGFAEAEAQAALGGDARLEVRCVNGGLFYSVVGGEGWRAGSPITFFWQGTLPPAGPAQAYQLIAGGRIGTAEGPAPAQQATGGC